VIATSVHDANARGTATVVVTAPPPPPPVEVRVSPLSAAVQVGDVVALFANVTGTANTAVTWSSSAAEIATVDADGVVTGRGPGTAMIAARSVAAPTAEGTSVVVVTSPPGPEVVVTPSAAQIEVGGELRFTAIVVGHADQRVTWESSNGGVAAIDSGGLARGLAAGATLVTARPVAHPDAAGAAQLLVNTPPPPTVSVQAITTTTGAPVSASAVSGAVHVQLQASAAHGAGVSHLRLAVMFPGGAARVVDIRPLPAGFSGPVVVPVHTAAYDPATGIPEFTNGLRQFRAELLDPTGAALAAGLSAPLTFANENSLHLLLRTEGVAGPGSATVGGVLWHEGDVVVSGLPVRYADGAYGAAELCIRAVDGPHGGAICQAVTPEAGAFHATFRRADPPTDPVTPGVGGMATTLLRAYGSTALVGGGAGPAVAAESGPTIRLDNLPPLPFTLALPAHVQEHWLNADFTFTAATGASQTATATQVADAQPGTGTVSVTFHAVPAAAAGGDTPDSNAELVQQWPVVAAATGLESTAGNDGYVLLAAARDALGNATIQRMSETFGVDVVPPTAGFAVGSAPAASVNPELDWALSFFDEHSGLGTTLARYRMRRHTHVAGTLRVECVSHAAGSVFTAVPAEGCPWVAQASTVVAIPWAQGFYTAELSVVDRAGNVSAPLTASSLRDNVPPTVSGVASAGTGAGFTVTGTLTDDVGLGRYDVRYRFAGGASPQSALSFAQPAEIAAYGAPLVGSRGVQGAGPLVRGLQVGVGGPVAHLDALGFAAFDAAGNAGFGYAAATATWGGIPETVSGWTLASREAALCRSGSPACGDVTATATVLTAEALTAPGAARPFERVHFYHTHPGGYSMLIGTATQAASEEGGTQRIWTWTMTLEAALLPPPWWSGPTATIELFAVAVDAEGDALLAPALQLTLR
jgi:hypothetical protein